MWLFLLVLFTLATVVTLAKASLLERKRNGLFVIVGTAMTPLAFSPAAVRVSSQGLSAFLDDYQTLSNVCTILVIESFVMLLLAAHLINTHYDGKRASLGKAFCLLPSVGCVLGLLVLLTYLLNTVTVRSFTALTAGYSASVLLVLLLGAVLIRFLFKDWATRLEVMLILSFLQLVTAMFLPLIARGLSPPDHLVRPDWIATALSAGCVLLFVAVGYSLHGRWPRTKET